MRLPAPIGVIGTSVLARQAGAGAVLDGRSSLVESTRTIDAAIERLAPKQRKLMSRAAMLSTCVVREVLSGTTTSARRDTGLFAGVGASDAALDDFLGLVRASVVGTELSYERLGTHGLSACHPLFAFRTMNNFTLTHPAIAAGVRGPNAAFFSRGAATAHAFVEAAWAMHEGECERSVVLGADDASHPLTLRETRADGGAITDPTEAACAMLFAPPPSAETRALLVSVDVGRFAELDASVVVDSDSDSAVVIVADARTRASILGAHGGHVVDLVGEYGTTLAAGPVLGACLATEWIARGLRRRTSVLAVDRDGTWSRCVFANRGDA